MTVVTDCVVVQTTMANANEATALARDAVERRLAACVQWMPIRSTYRWKGAIESAEEVLLAAKTTAAAAPALFTFIRERHSYELPEIVMTPIAGGLDDYLEWIRSNVDGPKADSR